MVSTGKEINTKVDLSGLILDNPVIPASGTFGYGREHAGFYDLNVLGSIAIKGTTMEPRYGNPQVRIAECSAGMLNAVGLQNPGAKKVAEEELKNLAKIYAKPVIANISGFSITEYEECAGTMDRVENVGMIEVNISCPNVHEGGMAFGTSAKAAADVTRAVKKICKKPVYVKLSPNVTDICEIAKACEDAGADGLSLINTLLGMRIDIKTGRPVLANITGGLSGPAIFPVALRMVYDVTQAVNIPVMGMGGIRTAEDVIEMIMAGAAAVQVGAANLVDPCACKKLIEELPRLMAKLNIKDINEVRGCAWK